MLEMNSRVISQASGQGRFGIAASRITTFSLKRAFLLFPFALILAGELSAAQAPQLVLRLGGKAATAVAEAGSGHLVLVLTADAASRDAMLLAGKASPEALTVIARERWDPLPVVSNSVDRVVIEDWAQAQTRGVVLAEVLRVLAPATGRLEIHGLAPELAETLAGDPRVLAVLAGAKAVISAAGGGVLITRPAPAEWDEWCSLQSADATGRAVSGERMAPRRNSPFAVQYTNPNNETLNGVEMISQPMWPQWVDGESFNGDKSNRHPILVSAGVLVHSTYMEPGRMVEPGVMLTHEVSKGQAGLVCRRVGNGLIVWQRSSGQPLGIHAGVLLVRERRNLVALDLATGAVKWKIADILVKAIGNIIRGADLAIADGLVMIADQPAAVALNLADGSPRWRIDKPHQGCWIQAGKVLLARGFWANDKTIPWGTPGKVAMEGVSVHDARDGRELWQKQASDVGGKLMSAVGLRAGLAIVTVDNDLILALDATTGREAWRSPILPAGPKQNVELRLMRDRLLVSNQILHKPHDGYVLDLATGLRHDIVAKDWLGVGVGKWACQRGAMSEGMVDAALGTLVPKAAPAWVSNFPIQGGCGFPPPIAWGISVQHRLACGCDVNKPQGIIGVAPVEVDRVPRDVTTGEVQRGPAWGNALAGADGPGWRVFRGDAQRRASAAAAITLTPRWSVELGTRLPAGSLDLWASWRSQSHYPTVITSPVAADGVAVVALPLRRTVVAVDLATGAERWRFMAEGVIDSPPALTRGRCVFGSRDGWLHALDMTSGKVVWSLRLTPIDERLVVHGTLESRFPVVGAVLPQGDTVIATVGMHGLSGLWAVEVALADGSVRSRKHLGRRALYNDAIVADRAGVLHLGATALDAVANPKSEGKRLIGLLGKRPTMDESQLVPISSELIGSQRSASVTRPDNHIALGGQRGMHWAWNDTLAIGISKHNHDEKGKLLGTTPKGQLMAVAFEAEQRLTPAGLRWSCVTPGEVWAMALSARAVIVGGPMPADWKQKDKPVPDRIDAPSWLALHGLDDGKELARADLPAPPVQDGFAIIGGMVLVSTWDGRLTAFGTP